MSTLIEWKRARRRSINNREFLVAVCDNNLEEVNRLINSGTYVNFKDTDGRTALSLAAEYGNVKTVQLLLDKGVSLDIKSLNDETPLDTAKRLNRPEIVEIFRASTEENLQWEISNGTKKSTPLQVEQQNGIQNTNKSNKSSAWNNAVHGNIYQLKVLMLFLYRGVTREYSFRLGTEVKEAGKFDDLVFEYTHDNTKVYRLLQAKHKIDETKKITVHKLFSETNGDYSLVKYFHSYQACKKDDFFKDGSIKEVTICTNIDFDFDDLKKAKIELVKFEEKDDILEIKNESKNPMRYKLTKSVASRLRKKLEHDRSNSIAKSVDAEIEDFLNHLVFAVNQPNEGELGEIIKKEIGKEADPATTETMYNKFFIRMLDCFKGRSNFMSFKEGKELFEEFKKSLFIWFNVHEPVRSFTGRLELMENVHGLLQAQDSRLLCICGLGGVGKTEFVRKYISENSQCYDNKIVWIIAESYQTLVNSFRQLASDKLDISTTNADGKEKDINSIISQVYQYFSKAKSLFIFDNAEMYRSNDEGDSGISRFLPNLPSGCNKPYVIITSRNQKWPESVRIQVFDGFTENEVVTFISENLHLKSDKEKEHAKQLGLRLQLLPLALQQAVAYIKSQNEDLGEVEKGFKIPDYLERFLSKSAEILNFEFPNHSDNKYSKTVVTTWNVTLDDIKRKQNGYDAINLLNILAYLLPNDISQETLSSFIRNKKKLISSVELLQQYSLIEVQNRILSIHRLVQQVTRIKLIEIRQEKDVLAKCLIVINPNNVNSKNVSHFLSIWTHCRKYPDFYKKHAVASGTLVAQLDRCSRSEEARSITAELAEILRKSSPKDVGAQNYLAGITNNDGALLMSQGKFEEALKVFQRSYEDLKRLRGPYDETTLMSKHNMGGALFSMGRTDKSLVIFKEVLKYFTIHFGENHCETLSVRNSIAECLIKQGNINEGLSMAQAVYAKQKVALGEYHKYTLLTKRSIANALKCLNKHDEALKIYQELYHYQKSNYAENHPHILDLRYSIASILAEQGNTNAALEIFNGILEDNRKIYGEKHLQTLQLRSIIATILYSQGQNDTALQTFKDLVKIYRKVLGQNHTKTLDSQTDVAYVLRDSNKLEEALKMFQETFKKQKTNHGINHPNTQRAQAGIASAFERQGKSAESLKIYEDILQRQISFFGVNDARALAPRNYIAEILIKDKKYDAALKQYAEMYRVLKDSFGANDKRALAIKWGMAQIQISKYSRDENLESLGEMMKVQMFELEKAALFKRMYEAGQEAANVPSSAVTSPIVAVQKNQLSVLEKFIKEGVDVNSHDANGGTLLHHAVNLGFMKIIKFLLRSGADVTRTTTKGNTPLHMATSKGNFDVVKVLLESVGRDKLQKYIDTKTCKSGSAALHIAAKSGFLEVTWHLLSRGATYDLKNKDNQLSADLVTDQRVKHTLTRVDKLFKLANSGNEEFIDMLKRCPMDEYLAVINARNEQGYNLMQVAVTKNHHHLVSLFHDLTRKEFFSIYTMPLSNTNLDRLLSLADSVLRATQLAKLNLERIYDPARNLIEKFRSSANFSPNPNIDIIDDMLILLKSSASAREFADLALGVIAYHVERFRASIQLAMLLTAAKDNDLSKVKKLVYEGVDINVTDSGGWTPLHYAANTNNEKMVGLLLSKGARVNCVTITGKFTPLHLAVNTGNIELVKLLLRSHSSIEFVDAKTEAKGSTALHIAVQKSDCFISRLLLAHGANYQSKNKDGLSPADVTLINKCAEMINKVFVNLADDLFTKIKKGHMDVIDDLKNLLPEVLIMSSRMRNSDGCTLMEVAVANKHFEIADEIGRIFKTKLTEEEYVETLNNLCLN